MINISIRDKETADEFGSPYLVLITTNSTAYSAYRTIKEFMDEWRDTLEAAHLTYSGGSKTFGVMADWNINDAHEYAHGIRSAIDNGARPCALLSNGSIRSGAILVDAANKQTTFFRLNPNDKEY